MLLNEAPTGCTKEYSAEPSSISIADSGGTSDDTGLLVSILALKMGYVQARAIANILTREFGDAPSVLSATHNRLKGVSGVTEEAIDAIELINTVSRSLLRRELNNLNDVSDWDALIDYLHVTMARRQTEEFRVVFLNSMNFIIRDESMSIGTVDRAPVYPREIIKRALELGASCIILVHNHPSGKASPSRDDIIMTRAILEAGRHLSVGVRDHVIIGRAGHFSMRAHGFI